MDMSKEQALAALQAVDQGDMIATGGYEVERIPAGGWRLTPTIEVALRQACSEFSTLEEALAAAGGSLVTVRP